MLHPNIPPVNNRHTSIREKCVSRVLVSLKHRVLPFVVTLIAPEWTLAWAMQQWSIANGIVKEGGQGWTRTHGFFVLMGGFHAFTRDDTAKPSQDRDAGTPWYPLDRDTVLQLVKKNEIELPLEEEIQDRSKTDWLGTSLVILQTGWFVMQCIARGKTHLPLSELEVVTLAYMVVNVWIYIVWWDKPRNVDRPIRVFMPKEMVQQERKNVEREKVQENGWKQKLFLFYLDLLPGNDSRLSSKTFLVGWTSVPLFYPGRPCKDSDILISAILSPIAGVLFGAVHCIAWSYPFPSPTERLLWRLSSIIMIGVPAFLLPCFVATFYTSPLRIWYERRYLESSSVVFRLIHFILQCLIIVTLLLCMVAYAAARITTVVLALRGLTSLPSGIFHTVPWTKWIPHI